MREVVQPVGEVAGFRVGCSSAEIRLALPAYSYRRNQPVLITFILLLSLLAVSHAAAEQTSLVVLGVAHSNAKAKEYVPETDPLAQRLESALADSDRFRIVPLESAKNGSQTTDYGVFLVVSAFDRRTEYDLFLVRAFLLPDQTRVSAIVYSARTSAGHPSQVLEAIDRLAKLLGESLPAPADQDTRHLVYSFEFDCKNESIQAPVQYMAIGELVNSSHFAVILADKSTKNGFSMSGFRTADRNSKLQIARAFNIEAVLTGRIDPVGDEYVFSLSLESPVGAMATGNVSTPFSDRPDQVRELADKAVRALLDKYRIVCNQKLKVATNKTEQVSFWTGKRHAILTITCKEFDGLVETTRTVGSIFPKTEHIAGPAVQTTVGIVKIDLDGQQYKTWTMPAARWHRAGLVESVSSGYTITDRVDLVEINLRIFRDFDSRLAEDSNGKHAFMKLKALMPEILIERTDIPKKERK